MKYNPLELILELSEVFQEVLKMAAIDGIINSWCFEVTLTKGIETFKQGCCQNSQQHIMGLHSLLFFLLEKLNDPNHDFTANSCNCGWNSSLVPSFLHPALERYTSGTVIRWAQGECHVLLSLPDDTKQDTDSNLNNETEENPPNEEDDNPSQEENPPLEEDSISNQEENPLIEEDVAMEEQNQNSFTSDDENSCMLVINEDLSNDFDERKPPSVEVEDKSNKEDDKSDDDIDSDDSGSVTSSSSSSSYSSTSSDDDDRISFKQRIEEAVQAAREAEASKISQIEPPPLASTPSQIENTSVQNEDAQHMQLIIPVQRHPDDIQAAQGLAALGKNPNNGLVPPPSRKVAKVSQKLFENQTFEVIRISSKAFECSVCGKQYDRYVKVLEHQSSHTGQKPWECETCGKKFANHHSLLKHNRAKHVPTHLQEYVCYVCQKNFGNQSSLQTHMSTHAPTKPFGCNVCGRTFALKVTLDTHEAQHTGNRPWLCNICGRSYITKYKLRAHMKAHTGELFCIICNRQFFSQDVLTRHRKKHEKGLIKHTSNTLGHKNKSRTSSKKSTVNFPQENFKCQLCNKVFNKSTDLSHHLSYCTAVVYCPPTQPVLSTPPLAGGALQLSQAISHPLGQPMEQCLLDKKIFSCPSQETESLGHPFILTEDIPSLTFQQPIHPQDSIIHCPNAETVNLPDFLKELPFVDGSNTNIFPPSQGQG